MGAGASIPTQIDLEAFKELSGDRFNQEVFDEVADENRTISRAVLFDLAQRSDVYISFCRSKMSLVPNNINIPLHESSTSSAINSAGGASGACAPTPRRESSNNINVGDSYLLSDSFMSNEYDVELASRVNEALAEMGLITFFDSHEAKLETQVRTAIDKASLMLMFISKNYVNMLNAGLSGTAMGLANDEEDEATRIQTMAHIYAAAASQHGHSHLHFKNMNQVEYAHALEVLGHRRIVPIIIDEDYSELYRLPECLSQLKHNEELCVSLYDEYEFDSGITQLIDIIYSNIRPLRQANWKTLAHSCLHVHRKLSDPTNTTNIAETSNSGNKAGSGTDGQIASRRKSSSTKKSALAGVDSKNLSKKARAALESYRSSKKQGNKGKIIHKAKIITYKNGVEFYTIITIFIYIYIICDNVTVVLLMQNVGDGSISESKYEDKEDYGDAEGDEDDNDLSDEMYSWVAAMSEWIADHAKVPVLLANTAGGEGAIGHSHSHTHTHGHDTMGSTSLTNGHTAGAVNSNNILARMEYVPISREVAQDCAFGLIQFGIHSIAMLYEALSKFPLFLTEVKKKKKKKKINRFYLLF